MKFIEFGCSNIIDDKVLINIEDISTLEKVLSSSESRIVFTMKSGKRFSRAYYDYESILREYNSFVETIRKAEQTIQVAPHTHHPRSQD